MPNVSFLSFLDGAVFLSFYGDEWHLRGQSGWPISLGLWWRFERPEHLDDFEDGLNLMIQGR